MGTEPALQTPRAASRRASNILPSNTQSVIAPVLPTPPAGDNGSPQQQLQDAKNALEQQQTGLAQEALERAEARVLSRPMPEGAVAGPVQDPLVDALKQARYALGRNDISAAHNFVGQAQSLIGNSAIN